MSDTNIVMKGVKMKNNGKATIQNNNAEIENIPQQIIDEVVKMCVQNIYEDIIGYDNYKDVIKDISISMCNALEEKSFMTNDLSLNEKQRNILYADTKILVENAIKNYTSNILTDDRTLNIIKFIETNIKAVIERLLAGIAFEINRGCILNCIAVSCDAKNEEYNKAEIRYSKEAGDLTIPTKGVFLSTNCIDVILNSIKVTSNDNKNPKDEYKK